MDTHWGKRVNRRIPRQNYYSPYIWRATPLALAPDCWPADYYERFPFQVPKEDFDLGLLLGLVLGGIALLMAVLIYCCFCCKPKRTEKKATEDVTMLSGTITANGMAN